MYILDHPHTSVISLFHFFSFVDFASLFGTKEVKRTDSPEDVVQPMGVEDAVQPMGVEDAVQTMDVEDAVQPMDVVEGCYSCIYFFV